MAKLNKRGIDNKNKIGVIYKLTAVLVAISIGLSVGFLNFSGNNNSVVAFSDNMFLVGTILLAIFIIINLFKNIFKFGNRNLYVKDNKRIEKEDEDIVLEDLTDEEKKSLLRYEQFIVVSRSILIGGIVNVIVSIIFAIFS